MAHIQQYKGLASKEEAKTKSDKLKSLRKRDLFKVEENDILMLTGPHQGKRLSEIWFMGSSERDYLHKHVYSSDSLQAKEIMKRYFAQS